MKTKKIRLVGFGTFETVNRKGRQGVNPSTGEKIKIAPRKAPKFRPGKAMKQEVQ